MDWAVHDVKGRSISGPSSKGCVDDGGSTGTLPREGHYVKAFCFRGTDVQGPRDPAGGQKGARRPWTLSPQSQERASG